MKVLWYISKPTYLPAGFFQLVTVLVQALTPIALQRLLNLFEQNPNTAIVSQGLAPAIALFICSIVDGIAQERQKFLSFQSGITIRAAVIGSIYHHMLQLSSKGKTNLLSGEMTNLVAIDCQKLFEVCQEGHLVWSCPLSMIIVTILLLLTMGPATLVGMASMFLMVPAVRAVVTRMMVIRRKRAAHTDQRVEVTTAMLQAIRFCKLNHYEEKFLKRVNDARKEELIWVRKELGMIGWTMTMTVLTPVIACTFTFITYVFINGGNVLTSADAFTTLLLFSVLRFPINYVGKLISKAAQGIEACQRIADFFDRDITEEDESNDTNINERKSSESHDEDDEHEKDVLLCVENGNFIAGDVIETNHEMDTEALTKASFSLSGINFTMKQSETLAIVGPVASGKSTLLHGLIGDVVSSNELKAPTKVSIKGRVAYASQSPFILNSTLRENILFGNEYDQELYDKVLNACNLIPDLKQLGLAGDLTEIGERGVTLSGGQKARISIARCVYAQPSVALFDDVLSALDASTGKWIFERLFDSSRNQKSLLSQSAVVLVTHASHFLSRVDKIVVLVKGKQAFLGNWDELGVASTSDLATKEAISSLRSSVQEIQSNVSEEDNGDIKNALLVTPSKLEDNVDEEHNALMTVEERDFGLSDWKTWLKWIKYAGGILFVTVTVVSLTIDRGFYVATEWWLATWTAGAYESITRLGITFEAQSEGLHEQFQFVKVYLIILLISFAATAIRSQIIIRAGGHCAEQLFYEVTNRVVKAPMVYFETTPIGRILNRLTYDVEILDISLSQSMAVLMISCGWFITGVVLQITILPFNVCILVPIIILYWLLLLYYRKSAVDLQRLDAVSRSPVQARLAEGIDGSSTIRVFDKINHFENLFKTTVDHNTAAMMNFITSQRWLGARFQVLGSFAVLFASIFVVSYNDKLRLETGIIAMLIIWTSNFTITLGFFSQAVSESEAYLTSVERLQTMTELPQENDNKTSETISLKQSWPTDGNLKFENVCLRYRKGLPLALNGLTFTAHAGQRVGVCGRTGAGKSTIAAALFRLCEIESGKIILDGQDLSTLGLEDVRGRKNGMLIIPQDPVLFSGSLRECLDPWGVSSDDEILEALKIVQVADAETRGLAALEDFVDEGGRNFSVGERQLLCLARAVLCKPKVLVLDEATASVDGETDAFIQKMIRSRFRDTTLLTIAHRLNTIMDYDVVLVMDKGRVGEFGTPKELLNDETGLFSSLVDSTGKESSLALREMVL